SEHDAGFVDPLQYSFQQRQLPLQFALHRSVRLPRDFLLEAALLASQEFCCLFELPESNRRSRARTLFSSSLYCRGSCSNKMFASRCSSSVSRWNCIAPPFNREVLEPLPKLNHGNHRTVSDPSVTKITGIESQGAARTLFSDSLYCP